MQKRNAVVACQKKRKKKIYKRKDKMKFPVLRHTFPAAAQTHHSPANTARLIPSTRYSLYFSFRDRLWTAKGKKKGKKKKKKEIG